MADTLTVHYEWVKPEITGSPNTWGNKWNANLDLIDQAIYNINTTFLPLAGGILTGPVHSSAVDGGGDQLITHDQAATLASSIATSVVTAYLPVGVIVLWSGALVSIPAHWQLCDGTNGTPDLRNRFVVGAGISYAVGSIGGLTSSTPGITVDSHVLSVSELPAHNHGVNDPGHGHTLHDPGHSHSFQEAAGAAGGAFAQIPFGGGGTTVPTSSNSTGISMDGALTGISIANTGSNVGHAHTASSTAVPTLPPYLALAYIMRV